jgi:hypothetical protein
MHRFCNRHGQVMRIGYAYGRLARPSPAKCAARQAGAAFLDARIASRILSSNGVRRAHSSSSTPIGVAPTETSVVAEHLDHPAVELDHHGPQDQLLHAAIMAHPGGPPVTPAQRRGNHPSRPAGLGSGRAPATAVDGGSGPVGNVGHEGQPPAAAVVNPLVRPVPGARPSPTTCAHRCGRGTHQQAQISRFGTAPAPAPFLRDAADRIPACKSRTSRGRSVRQPRAGDSRVTIATGSGVSVVARTRAGRWPRSGSGR